MSHQHIMNKGVTNVCRLTTKILLLIVIAAYATVLPAVAKKKDVILATTTSTQDSGLLDVLVPAFEKRAGYRIKTIAVGSGQAMAMGERGEADVLLVHSPAAEEKFMARGFGVNRRIVMHNDFVVVGPKNDPAGIKKCGSAAEAFKKIALTRSLFISRADNSGTYVKELSLWKKAGVSPGKGRWYQETGLGMGQTLSVVNEKQGYTLSDRATYLALRKNMDLAILFQGDKTLLNIYHVIEVNEKKFPKINGDGARAFARFLISSQTQKMIGRFGVAQYGSQLFFPDAVK
jgi:tungstate transport system substrate-binding protein